MPKPNLPKLNLPKPNLPKPDQPKPDEPKPKPEPEPEPDQEPEDPEDEEGALKPRSPAPGVTIKNSAITPRSLRPLFADHRRRAGLAVCQEQLQKEITNRKNADDSLLKKSLELDEVKKQLEDLKKEKPNSDDKELQRCRQELDQERKGLRDCNDRVKNLERVIDRQPRHCEHNPVDPDACPESDHGSELSKCRADLSRTQKDLSTEKAEHRNDMKKAEKELTDLELKNKKAESDLQKSKKELKESAKLFDEMFDAQVELKAAQQSLGGCQQSLADCKGKAAPVAPKGPGPSNPDKWAKGPTLEFPKPPGGFSDAAAAAFQDDGGWFRGAVQQGIEVEV